MCTSAYSCKIIQIYFHSDYIPAGAATPARSTDSFDPFHVEKLLAHEIKRDIAVRLMTEIPSVCV